METEEAVVINYNFRNVYFTEIKHQTNKLTKDSGSSIIRYVINPTTFSLTPGNSFGMQNV